MCAGSTSGPTQAQLLAATSKAYRATEHVEAARKLLRELIADGINVDLTQAVRPSKSLQNAADDLGDLVEELEEAEYEAGMAAQVDLTVQCKCGTVSGGRCGHVLLAQEMVVIEWMPPHLRASHEAAGNQGTYPHNGAMRLVVTHPCAEMIADTDAPWTEMVPGIDPVEYANMETT